ncbi:MAG: glycosyltransferase family 4 protein [Bacteroidia bacterium]|nr:glycosyltransferase family 4 protein [Bacteroidia bacterium]
MRILQICNKAPYPPNDGSSIAITTLAEGLTDNGVELYLLAINTKKHFKSDNLIPESFKQKTHYQSIYQNTDTGVLGAFINLFSKQSYFVSRFYFNAYKQALIQLLQQHSFDIVQIEGVFMATYIPVIRQYSQAKIVLRSHNVEHQIWERHLANEKTSLKKIYLSLQNNRLKHFELSAFNLVDAIVTITDEDKKNIQQIVPTKKLYTCLTGVNLTQYTINSNMKYPGTLFHFASMDWMPNIEAVDWLLNEVWSLVIKQQRSAKLVLAGRGMPERFKRLSSPNVLIVEEVKSSEEFYKNHDIMLVPLWSGSGLRIKLVEGLAYGKAIVTTSIGAEGIPYTNNQHILIADTAQAFADAILELLDNDSKKQAMQQQARLLAEQHFDYKLIGKNLIEFYKQLS